MSRRMISTGSHFEGEYAYARAVIQGEWCFVAGTTGYDYKTMSMPEGALEQARQAFATIAGCLDEGGFSMADVVRVHYYLAEASIRKEVAPALRETFSGIRPAATMTVTGLIAPEMKIEIEATAFRRTPAGGV